MKPRSESAYYARPEISAPLFEAHEKPCTCGHSNIRHSILGSLPCIDCGCKGFSGNSAHARSTDPETSHAASRSVVNLGRTRDAILRILAKGPKTDEQIAEHFNMNVMRLHKEHASPSGLRSRRSELVAMGFVRDSGRTAKTQSGRDSILWEIAK